MHRVASRQRLFSWDHFDAARPADYEENGDNDNHTTVRTNPSSTTGDKNNNDNTVSLDASPSVSTSATPDEVQVSPTVFFNTRTTTTDIENDDSSDYGTCISMSRHASMLFTQSSSFGMNDNNDNEELDTAKLVSDDEQDIDNNKECDSYHDSSALTIIPLMSKPAAAFSESTRPDLDCASVSTTSTQTSAHMSSSVFDLYIPNYDVQLHILSFLDLHGLRAMNLTCHYFMNLLSEPQHQHQPQTSLASCARNAIWWNIMKNTWPYLSLGDHQQNNHDNDDSHTTDTSEDQSRRVFTPDMVEFVSREKSTSTNTSNTPCWSEDTITATKMCNLDDSISSYNSNNNNSQQSINYGVLLAQAATENPPPTCINPSFFELQSTTQTQLVQLLPNNTVALRRIQRPTPRKLFTRYTMNVSKDDLNAYANDSSSSSNNNNNNENPDECTSEKEMMKVEVVQYLGRVGVGDRSIRSNQPLPRPLKCLPVFVPENHMNEQEEETNYSTNGSRGKKRALSVGNNDDASGSSAPMKFFECLRSCNRRAGSVGAVIRQNQHRMSIFAHTQFANGNNMSPFNSKNNSLPFVSPIVSKVTHLRQDGCPLLKRFVEIDLTPRLMAYFEVSILPRDETQEVHSNITPHQVLMDEEEQEVNSNASACVAIGLSMREYSSTLRMPGWDMYSYGYHGDDGGIFHSRGDMIRVYGPRYNVGDTVGCGVNYSNGGIFFTLNGDFLGYAWCNERVVMDGQVDLFPTIGVDAPNPIACNFGNEEPFVWDFPKFVATNGSSSGP